jgi:hypothetical protein
MLWFGIYFHSMLCIAFEGTVLWNAQLDGLSVMDITVLCLSVCGMIHLFLCRISWRKISSHVNVWSLNYVCAVHVLSLAKKCADALARWVETGSSGEGNDHLMGEGYTVISFRTVLKFSDANLHSVVSGMMKVMIHGSYKPYWTCRGPDSVAGTMTCYGLDGPGFKSQWGQDIFSFSRHTSSDWPWGPPVLCSRYQDFFLSV